MHTTTGFEEPLENTLTPHQIQLVLQLEFQKQRMLQIQQALN